MLQYEDTPVVVSKVASSSHCSNNNALLETITTAAIALKPDGTARWMNEKARALTGWHESEFSRLPVFIELALRMPETHADIRFERDENGIAKLDSSTANHLLLTDKNNATHHISCICMGVENRAEECLDSILLLTDISEHFQISRAHDIGEFETDKLVDASEVATWAMNIDSGEVSVNKRWFTMLGYTPGELDPVDMKLWREIVHPDDHPQTIQDLDAHFQGNTPRYEADIRMKHKDGHWVWVHAVGKVSEWSEGGRAKMLLGSHRDITERKLGEQSAIDRERHLRNLLDNLFVFVAVLSPNGRVEWVNKAPLQLAGLELGQVVGQYFWETPWFTQSADAAHEIEQGCRAARQGDQCRFDVEVKTANGADAVTDFMISPLYDDSGNITHLIPTAADISERHRMIKEAQDSKHLLESVIENIPAMVFVKDAKELRYTHLNRTGEEMMNVRREELLGRNTYEIFPAAQAAGFERKDREALLLDQGTEITDHQVTRGDGTPGFYRTSKVAMRDAQGNATHLLGISLDVTTLKESEQALQNLNKELETRVNERTKELAYSEERFRTAMHESSIGMALVSLDGVWLDVNKRIVEMLGYSKEELLQLNFRQISHAEDLEADLTQLARLLSGEVPNYQIDKRFIHRDGQIVWAQLNVSRANDENGDGLYLISQLQDVTREKLRAAATQAITHDFASLEFDQYCKHTIEKLCELFQLDCAFISELADGSASQLHTRAIIMNDEHLPTISYEKTKFSLNDLAEGERTYFLDSDYETLYANNTFFADNNITAYAEVPLYSSSGRLIGYIGVMHSAPVEYSGGLSEVLILFAVAVGTILDRERSQRRYHDLVAFAPNGMLMLDTKGVIKLANIAAEQQLHRNADALLGSKLSSMIAEDERRRIGEFLHVAGVSGHKDTSQTTTLAIREDGSRYPIELCVSSTGDEHGLLLSVTLTDLSSRYEAEREMRQALAMLDATEEAAFIVDPETHKFTYVNYSAADQLGYSREELLRLGPTNIIAGMTESELTKDLAKLHRQKGKSSVFRTNHVHRAGHEFPVQVSLRYIELQNDHDCYVALARDITERLQQEEDRAARVQAEEANAAKSAFLAAMSHEIRTPMNGVIGSVDLLARSSLMAQQVDLVGTISESANGLLRVIDDILDFSKIDAGKLDLESEPVSLRHEAESACAALSPVALQKNVDLFLFTAPLLPNWILSDSVRLRQILNNLISNAIKFSSSESKRGTVEISIEEESGNSISMTVTDNGIGMKEEALDKLFQPFAQAEASTTRRFGGTGLGLSICRRLVEMLEGTIEVSSTYGVGTRFCVKLPYQLDTDTSPPPADPRLDGICCVLVAPESLAPRNNWHNYLLYAGAKVNVCSRLDQARAFIKSETASETVVILTDTQADTANAWRKTFESGSQPCIVLLENGQRRAVRRVEDSITLIDQPAMTIRNFLLAVALAAGKQEYEIELEPRVAEQTRKTMNRKEAIDKGQLILIAEDNEVNQKVIRRQLDLLGYAADVMKDGREALYAWKTGEYGLLLTDLHMPEMDGYELTASIRAAEQAGERLPIIALTANALKDEKARCIERGMDDYLTKPIALEKLEDAIKGWLPKNSVEDDTPYLSPVLDTSVLISLIGDEEALIAEFLSDYETALKHGSIEILSALKTSNMAAVRDAAHKLKASSRSVGAMQMGDYCEKLEQLEGPQTQDLKEVLDTFEKLLAQLNGSLKEILAIPA